MCGFGVADMNPGDFHKSCINGNQIRGEMGKSEISIFVERTEVSIFDGWLSGDQAFLGEIVREEDIGQYVDQRLGQASAPLTCSRCL